MKQHLKISYIGGGSMFVCTMAHAVMNLKDYLVSNHLSLEFSLMDINLKNAELMRQYVEIVNRKTGTPLTAAITDSMEETISGADMVILSVPEKNTEQNRFWDLIRQEVDLETPYAVSLTAVTNLHMLDQIAGIMKRTAPDALFAALTNPTDTIAAYMQRKHGLQSIGICVEVQNLTTTLAYLFGVQEEEISLSHIGVNHVGWVTSLTVQGQDGYGLLKEKIAEWKQRPDWPRYWNWFADLFCATGYLRTSDAHRWPIQFDWIEGTGLGKDEIPKPISDLYRPYILEAIEKGELVGNLPQPSIYGHVQYEALMYPSLKGTFSEIVKGLFGETAKAVPLQVKNGGANPQFSPEAWLEIPARFEGGNIVPLTADPIPDWVAAQVSMLIKQREWIASWLIGEDPAGLQKALFSWQDTVEISHAVSFWQAMEQYLPAQSEKQEESR